MDTRRTQKETVSLSPFGGGTGGGGRAPIDFRFVAKGRIDFFLLLESRTFRRIVVVLSLSLSAVSHRTYPSRERAKENIRETAGFSIFYIYIRETAGFKMIFFSIFFDIVMCRMTTTTTGRREEEKKAPSPADSRRAGGGEGGREKKRVEEGEKTFSIWKRKIHFLTDI